MTTPDKKTDKAILFLHGITNNYKEPNWTDRIGKKLVDQGYTFLAINDRAHDLDIDLLWEANDGEKHRRGGSSYFIFDEIEYDIAGSLDYLTGIGINKIVLGGHSLGCNKSLLYISKHRKDVRVKAALLLSPVDNAAIGNAKLMPGFPSFLKLAKDMVSKERGASLMPSDAMFIPMSAQTYYSLFKDGSLAGIFPLHDLHASFKELNQIHVPVILFYATNGMGSSWPRRR